MSRSVNKRRKVKDLDVDITSLLDILVILLVFLLKSYNPSELKLDLENELTPPISKSTEFGVNATTIQVTKRKDLYINNEKTLNIIDSDNWKEILQEKLKEIPKDKKEIPSLNIVLHNDLNYGVLDDIMLIASSSGVYNYSFIVQSNNQ